MISKHVSSSSVGWKACNCHYYCYHHQQAVDSPQNEDTALALNPLLYSCRAPQLSVRTGLLFSHAPQHSSLELQHDSDCQAFDVKPPVLQPEQCMRQSPVHMPDGSMTQAAVCKTMCARQGCKARVHCRFTLMGVRKNRTWIP